jgi:hypothetical protein
MCFSATASFVTSGGLTLVGVDALRIAPKSKRVLAVVPLLFAFQQALEGVQWLALGSGTVCMAAGYGFLSFAYVFWPVFVPVVVYVMDRKGRADIRWFILLGGGVALWYLTAMVSHPLVIFVSPPGRIVYDFIVPYGRSIAILYVLAVAGAPLLSSMRVFRWYGALLILLTAVAMSISYLAFASIWCFLGALSSVLIWLYLRRRA